MHESLKNNELVTGISILAVLKNVTEIEVTKVLLIEPMFSYTSILSFLSRKNSSIHSIEDLIIKQCVTFTNFNNRFFEKLDLTMNSIMLFQKMGLLRMSGNKVLFLAYDFDFNNRGLGEIVCKRIMAADKLAEILKKGDATDLYLSLRIEI